MSTNYYLVQDPQAPACRSCGSNPTQIHIGLSSMGWTFTWQGYRKGDGVASFEDLNLTTVAEWTAFLREKCAEGWVILDEYDRPQELGEFLMFIDSKRATGRRHADEYSRDLTGSRLDSHTDPCGDGVCFYAFS